MDATQSSTPVLPILDSRVDWLTATAQTNGRARELLALASALQTKERREGFRVKPWNFCGYGGFRTGHVRYGIKADSTLVQLSGAMAAEHFLAAVGAADHVSRIDLAVTVLDESRSRDLAREAWENYLARHNPGGPWPHATLITTTQSGRTCYIGRRASAAFRRIYDKHVESGGHYPPGTWRYELECKQGLAVGLSREDHRRGLGSGGCSDYVHRDFARLGVQPAFRPLGAVRLPTYRPRPPDVDRTLRWLETAVRPSVHWCASYLGWDAVTSALGLRTPSPSPGSSPDESS